MDAPQTIPTTAGVASGILLGGAAVGGALGAASSSSYRGLHAATGAILGIMATTLGGVIVSASSDKWRSTGAFVAGLGSGGVLLLAAIGAMTAKNQLTAPPPAPKPSTPPALPVRTP